MPSALSQRSIPESALGGRPSPLPQRSIPAVALGGIGRAKKKNQGGNRLDPSSPARDLHRSPPFDLG
uniref:Uncharacterized protein n=1 Tax=Arundo donax TaxID=35708 RepID=A0A0A9HQ14_ARUDO